MLSKTTKTLRDVHTDLRRMGIVTKDTILIGHSIDSDLRALRMVHGRVIDTSHLYPHPRGPPFKHSLKTLAKEYLSEDIQAGDGTSGHDSFQVCCMVCGV